MTDRPWRIVQRRRTHWEVEIMEVLKFFRWEHLPTELAEVSRPCEELAQQMAKRLPANAETFAGMRKLLEAKDCFVRAAMDDEP